MPTFRKKPVVVEAWHFDAFDDQSSRMPQPIWMHEAIDAGSVWYQGGLNPYFTIKTLEGEMRANVGDWIIKGVNGELYPCKPDIFEKTYEAM